MRSRRAGAPHRPGRKFELTSRNLPFRRRAARTAFVFAMATLDEVSRSAPARPIRSRHQAGLLQALATFSESSTLLATGKNIRGWRRRR